MSGKGTVPFLLRYLAGARAFAGPASGPKWLALAGLDGKFRSRPPAPEVVADVLQIFPARSFVESLPESRLPDRDDFFRFASDPDERIRRWSEAFGRDLASGSWLDRLESMPLG
jgi:hypothetical protein